MFSRKSTLQACIVCGEMIPANEGRLVDKNRVAKTEIHRHIGAIPPAGEHILTPHLVFPKGRRSCPR